MLNDHFIPNIIEELESELRKAKPLNNVGLSPHTSVWVAASLLQKAVRRGWSDWAERAAYQLLRDDPKKLWRRLAVIAVEDVGVADVKTVCDITAIVHQINKLTKIFELEKIAGYAVRKLVYAVKCRAVDDLYLITETSPVLDHFRMELEDADESTLFERLAISDSILEQAMAARYLLGTQWPRGKLRSRKGVPKAYFDELIEMGIPASIVEISKTSYRLTSEPISGLFPIVYSYQQTHHAIESRVFRSDDFAEEISRSGIPTCAYDQYTREGKQVLRSFLSHDNAVTQFLNTNLPKSKHLSVASYLSFYVESGLMANRLQWDFGKAMLDGATFDCTALDRRNAKILFQLLKENFHLIEKEHANV